jgi:hypothetical protein
LTKRKGFLRAKTIQYEWLPMAPFVLGCRQKYSMENQALFSAVSIQQVAPTPRATQVHQSDRGRIFSSFRFPETKSAHLKFSPLSDHNLRRLIMFARNISIHLKSNMLSDYTRAFDKDVLPLLRKQNGFKDEITLAGPGGVDVTAISLWENKNDADTYNTNTYPTVLKTLARFIEGTPQVHTFDVVSSTFEKHAVLA